MVKKRAYVESSVISYLAAWPSRDDLIRGCQLHTALWWEHRHEWDCFVSTTVMEEIARGDPIAAAQRLEKAQSLAILPTSPEADFLAKLLLAYELVPEPVKADAYHLATAAIHGMDYLLTWNQKHLDNFILRSRIEEFVRNQGWRPAKVLTPTRLLLEESR